MINLHCQYKEIGGRDKALKITYIAHSSFLIETNSGVKILTDPYDASVGYKLFNIEADIVTTSHKHFDHAYLGALKGNYVLVDKPQEYNIKGVKVRGIKTFHDNEHGKKRGENIVFVIEDEFKIAHLGDLGHELEKKQIDEIGSIDILLVPVGGVFTIDAKSAYNVVKSLSPKIIIPMHYKTDKLKFDLGKLNEFTKWFAKVELAKSYVIDIKDIPDHQRVIVLDHMG